MKLLHYRLVNINNALNYNKSLISKKEKAILDWVLGFKIGILRLTTLTCRF